MALFLSKKKPIFISFPEAEVYGPIEETPFWEEQRKEAVEILSRLFDSWQTSWNRTKSSVSPLNLSESGLRRLNYYESEQKKEIVSLLAKLLVSWEKNNESDYRSALLLLAKELRPSLPYVEYEPEENFSLSPDQLQKLRYFIGETALSLKETVSDLQKLHSEKFAPELFEPLTEPLAESLIREKLGLTFFDFLDFKEEPDFSQHGYYPELIQESTDFGF